MKIRSSIYFLPIFLLCTLEETLGLIHCPLVWMEHQEGIPLPEFIVPTAEGAAEPIHFVARSWKHRENAYFGGRMERNQVYVAVNGTGLVEGNYEVLTNPNACQIKWASSDEMEEGERAYQLPVDKSSGGTLAKYIGRAVTNNQLLAGEVSDDVLTVVLDQNSTDLTQRFQFLLSFSYGLRLEMSKFELLNDDTPAKSDVLGVDQIFNQADSEVRQWVSFSKRILESTKIDSMRSWGKILTVKVTLDFSFELLNVSVPVGGVGFMHGSENGEFTNSSITRGTERLIEVTREVVVPPMTNVLVRSTIVIKENFESEYVAEGLYFSPGLTADEVEAILAEDDIVGTKDKSRNVVIVSMRGTIAGSLALNNKFSIDVI